MGKQVVVAEYWRYRPTGAVWAVTLVNGIVIGACGPLADADATRNLLHYLPYSERGARWVNGHRGAFQPAPRYGRLPEPGAEDENAGAAEPP